jgi:hypothetical protein
MEKSVGIVALIVGALLCGCDPSDEPDTADLDEDATELRAGGGGVLIDAQFKLRDGLADKLKLVGNLRHIPACFEGFDITVELQPVSFVACVGGVEYAVTQVNTITYECIDGEMKIVDEDVDVIGSSATGRACDTFDLPW